MRSDFRISSAFCPTIAMSPKLLLDSPGPLQMRFRSHQAEGCKGQGLRIPQFVPSGHLVGLPKMWERLAARAKLKAVTLHGLRHWFASAATELGYPDLIIGALLGHAKKGITGRYATAPDPALVAAADKISIALAGALDGAATGKVVSIR